VSTAIQFRGGTSAQHTSFTGANREITVDTDKHVAVVHDGSKAGGFPGARAELVKRAFIKSDSKAAAFTKTGAGTISTGQQIYVEVADLVIGFAASTAVTMPSLTAGTDYAIYACADGTIRADSNFTTPSGYTASNSRQIGGFHYAPGGNATGTSGGDTTPAINAYSIWDLKFRPQCKDPRGMALVAGGFWSDIYLCGVNHLTDGTSKYNVTMTDGSSPPKVASLFGGDGSTAYSGGNWFNFAEVMKHHGKRLPSYSEFAALAYGTTENSSVGSDQGSTVLNSVYTSKWGVIQASGVLWVWGDEFIMGPETTNGWGWRDSAGGRGQLYESGDGALRAVIFGGHWDSGASAGSRASDWSGAPSSSYSNLGARGVCDHLILE
jgi:hypothetical protein